MCLDKYSKRRKARRAINCYKVMYLSPDGMRVNSMLHPKGDGYSVGDVMLPSVRLSNFGFINRRRVDRLKHLNGEVVHSFSMEDKNYGFYRSGLKGIPVVVMCEIPKGETYWLGLGDEYGSLSLKIKEIQTTVWRIDVKYKKVYNFFRSHDSESLITAKMLFTLDELIHYIDTHNVGVSSYSIYSHDALTGDSEFVYAKVLE